MVDPQAAVAALAMCSNDSLVVGNSLPVWHVIAADRRSISRLTPQPAAAYVDAVLRPYQRAGVAWMQQATAHGRVGILADDMGLGKMGAGDRPACRPLPRAVGGHLPDVGPVELVPRTGPVRPERC